MFLTKSESGSALLTVVYIAAAIGLMIGIITTRVSNHVKINQKYAQKSDMRRILSEYASMVRGPEALQKIIANNNDVFQYVNRKGGSPPNSCPKVEKCSAAPMQACSSNAAKPACDPPSALQPLAAYDGLGRELIPKSGLYLDASFAKSNVTNHRWKINAFWSKQSQYRVHYHLEILRNTASSGYAPPGLNRGKIEIPSSACIKHRGEKFRRGWGSPTFDNSWHGTDIFCPNGYKLLSGWAYLSARLAHTPSVYPDPWNPSKIDAGFVDDNLRPDVRMSLMSPVNHPNNPDSSDINFVIVNCCWEDDDFVFE